MYNNILIIYIIIYLYSNVISECQLNLSFYKCLTYYMILNLENLLTVLNNTDFVFNILYE